MLGLSVGFFVARFKARGFAFSFFGWHQPPERQPMADRGGRCGLTRAVAGCEGRDCVDGQPEQQP